MLGQFIDWWRDDVWRSIALISTTLLIAVSAAFFFGGGTEEETDDGPGTTAGPATTATTTTSAGSVETTTSTANTTVAGATSPEGGLLAVKIDNSMPARPQIGIAEADILVEVPVEGGMTRFIAVYSRSASGLVGPVRSLRPVDADLLVALAPNVVSTGGQPFVLQDVEASGVQQIDAFNFEWFVSLGRLPPHDSFVDLDVLMSTLAGSEEEDTPGVPIGDLPAPVGEASMIQLPIGSAELRFEDDSYVRYESGRPVEVLTGNDETTPLEHQTVVVVFAAERSAGYQDSNDVPVSTFDVIGGGDLMVFSGGSVYSGTWSRSAQADPFVFRDPEGREFGVPEGSVYLAIVPRGSDLTFGS